MTKLSRTHAMLGFRKMEVSNDSAERLLVRAGLAKP